MKARVRMFAAARQLTGAEVVEVELPESATVAVLRAALLAFCPDLRPYEQHLLFAVNARYARDELRISENDEIACIPPVSGG